MPMQQEKEFSSLVIAWILRNRLKQGYFQEYLQWTIKILILGNVIFRRRIWREGIEPVRVGKVRRELACSYPLIYRIFIRLNVIILTGNKRMFYILNTIPKTHSEVKTIKKVINKSNNKPNNLKKIRKVS